MQQRQLRLGDIIDDYCPRERRITNHAVVAMVGEEVKQTRCTTCDSDHPYKHAQVPVTRRKKESVSAAYKAVLTAVQQEAPGAVVARVAEPAVESPGAQPVEPSGAVRAEEVDILPAAATATVTPSTPVEPEPRRPAAEPPSPPVGPIAPGVVASPAAASPSADLRADGQPVEGRVHRRLIRAQLPRLEGKEPAPRPIPQFTIHDARAAGFRGRGGQHGGGRPGGRGPFTRDAGGRGGGFSQRPPKPADHNRHARHSGRPHRPGKKHSK